MEQARAQSCLGLAQPAELRAEQGFHIKRLCRESAVEGRQRVESGFFRSLSAGVGIFRRDGRAGAQEIQDQAKMRGIPIDEVGAVRARLDDVPARPNVAAS